MDQHIVKTATGAILYLNVDGSGGLPVRLADGTPLSLTLTEA